ncbi:MAG: excinuclease ABC subunit UvrA [Patescibacteria group bacterium]|nr:excinuclease ABC subunit UvrA [Patescibacteria group bacterium]
MPKKPNKNIIKIKGARVHNLKNINVDIPRDKFVVITGLSGSGKSSLAFDTVYAEGQRRYVESMSAYARQFLGLYDKPDLDSIEGLSPAISIDQKTAPHNPRSTVGTVTEIYDYMRLLWARIGIPHCPDCDDRIKPYTVDEIVAQSYKDFLDKDILILAPLVTDKRGKHKKTIDNISQAGFARLRIDKNVMTTEEAEDITIDKQKKHTIEIVIDRLLLTKNKEDQARFTEAIEKAIELSDGLASISYFKDNRCGEEKTYSTAFGCPKCGITLSELEPRNFSFNSPHGACQDCSGLGTKLEIDSKLIINPNLSIAQGAIKPWSHGNTNSQTWLMRILGTVANKNNFDLNTPVKKLNKKQLDIVLHGTGKANYDVDYEASRFSGELTTEFEGVISNLERRYHQTESDYIRKDIEQYMRVLTCPTCKGKRLKKEMLAVKIAQHSIHDVSTLTIKEAKKYFSTLSKDKNLSAREKKIANQIFKEIISRLSFLQNVGLTYLTLNRAANTLSGGEAQRIRLANQIGTSLVGVIYILDEPSIGLHQRDNQRLIKTIKNLRDLGNSVIVVEHDEETMLSSDHLIDVGPGAGRAGGEIIFAGTPKKILKSKKSLTGEYLSGKKEISIPKKYRKGNGASIKIIGANEHNLKNIDVEFPLGKFIAITGVSGSGKSTLMTNILSKALSKKFYRAKSEPGEHKRIEGLSYIDKVININQSPIGRTPRSNPATYTSAFTQIRDLFTQVPEAKIKGYKPGRFSFNVIGGRCEACNGDGMVKIEMQFLPDVYVECDVCHGTRYNKETLEIKYKGKNISNVLKMTVDEAMLFFKNIPVIYQKISTLYEVGLGYIQLGQSATTLSGGEAQRVKLATELSRRATGKTLYILDEPTTGLHFDDIKKLLKVLNQLANKGNTVLIIEHNLDVIKSVDWIIDLGPEGGDEGGKIVAEGTPKDIIKTNTHTAKYLKKILNNLGSRVAKYKD